MSTDQTYLEITIQIPFDYQEILISELMQLDFDGFDQHNDRLLAYIPQTRFNDVSREEVETILAAQPVECSYIGEQIYEPRNWNEAWEQTIRPMSVGQFFVRPTWAQEDTPEGQILLEIDPKMAFGTGYHETTRCILRTLPEAVSGGESVLDIGTGTGILAIAALKLGSVRAFGFDIDEWSYVNATENAFINGVSDQFTVKEGSFEVLPEAEQYELVLANVNRNMLMETSVSTVGRVKSGGILILSGLLDSDEQDIMKNADYAHLTLKKRSQENEWICLMFQKP